MTHVVSSKASMPVQLLISIQETDAEQMVQVR